MSENQVSQHGIRLDYLDKSTNPGVDFFRFANGAYLDRAKLPQGYARWGAFDELKELSLNRVHELMERFAAQEGLVSGTNEQKIGDFYASGMDEAAIEAAGIKPIADELAVISRIETATGLAKAIARLHSAGVSVFFGFGSMQSFSDSTQMVAAAAQSGLTLPHRDYYLKRDKKSVERRRKYVEHISRMFQLAGELPHDARRHAEAVLAIETTLARATMPPEKMRDPKNIHHPMTVAQLQALAPSLAFDAYFAAIKPPAFTTVNCLQPKFFRMLDGVLTTTPLSEVKAYLRWHLISGSAPYLSSAFVKENFSFFGTVMSGLKEQRPRWKRVTAAVDGGLGEAVGQLYVAQYFPPEAKARALEMIENLKSVLREGLSNLDRMSDSTKHNALAKLDKTCFKIGYPETWIDYSTLTIERSANGGYAGNAMRVAAFAFRRDLDKIGKPVDHSEWGMTPQTVNAYADPQNVELCFPAAILQPPFFDPEADDATNYGGILVVIGHEFTHLFDDSGAQFDANGNVNMWWTKDDFAKFMSLIALIRKQFGGYKVGSVTLNGENVSGEAAADLGGITLSYRALQLALAKSGRHVINGYTDEQRFFISFGQIWAYITTPEAAEKQAKEDEHPAGQFRVNGTLANIDEFPLAFGLPEDCPIMLPAAQRCRLW